MKALIVIDIEDKAFEYYSKQNPKALTVGLMDHVGESRGFYSPKFLSLKPMPTAESLDVIPIKWILDEIEILKKQDDWVLKTFGEYSEFSTPYEVLLKKWRKYETEKMLKMANFTETKNYDTLTKQKTKNKR